jgi:hypothetical protein
MDGLIRQIILSLWRNLLKLTTPRASYTPLKEWFNMNQQTKGYFEIEWQKDYNAKQTGLKTTRLCLMLREINEIKSFGIISEFWQRILCGLEEDYQTLKNKIKERG